MLIGYHKSMEQQAAVFWLAKDETDLARKVSGYCIQHILSPEEATPSTAMFLLADGDGLVLAATNGEPPREGSGNQLGREGALAQALQKGQSRLLNTASNDPELKTISSLYDFNAIYLQPIAPGVETLAVLLLGHSDPDHFSESRCEELESLAYQTTAVLQQIRLVKNISNRNALLQDLYRHSRIRQARALHDGPTQSIAALAMQINYARRLLEKDQDAAMADLIEIENLARRTTIIMRHMLFTLHPLILETAGVTPALESLAEKTSEAFEQQINTELADNESLRLDGFTKSLVFSTAVEALNNACQHAQAEKVTLRFSTQGDSATLEIEDDGIGFDPQDTEQGLKNNPTPGMLLMHEYADLLRGELQVQSKKGEGTRVSFGFPVTAANQPHA